MRRVRSLMVAGAFTLGLVVTLSPAEARVKRHHHYDSGRPAACYGIPWCGCWARLQVGLDKAFNYSLHWLTLRHVAGRGAYPVVGAWAVMYRRGGGHVGKVVGVDGNGNPIIRSGNHNGQVATATYPRQRIAAYVEP